MAVLKLVVFVQIPIFITREICIINHSIANAGAPRNQWSHTGLIHNGATRVYIALDSYLNLSTRDCL
jgi:hypothetical protein